MNVTLDARTLEFVEGQIKAGRFRSADQLIHAAIANFRAEQELDEELTPDDIAELRADIAQGIREANDGQLDPWDPNEIQAEVDRRFTLEQKSKSR